MIIKGQFCLFLHKNICCGYSLVEAILMSIHNMFLWRTDKNYPSTRAGVCKTLCPQHLLVPKYGQICSVVIPPNILDLAQTFNR